MNLETIENTARAAGDKDVLELVSVARRQESELAAERDANNRMAAVLKQSLASYGAMAMELAAAKASQADLAEDAARWNFMMRAADDDSGPESKALDTVRIGKEQMEIDRKESLQMVELVDQARAAAKEQA